MLTRLLNCIAMMTFILAGTASANEANFRPKLGCIPFLATSLQAMAFTENISSSLLNSIDRSGYFEIVERKKIEQSLELEGLRLDNLNPESIVRIGSKGGLDYVVHGNVSTTETGALLEVNLVHIRSMKLVMKESFRMSESDFSRRLLEVAASIVGRVRNAASTNTAAAVAVVAVAVPIPKNLAISGTSNSIRLAWQCDDLNQVAGFNIYRCNTPDGQYSLHATATEPSFTDENLKLNEVFYYRVAAMGRTGGSSGMTAAVRGGTAVAPSAPIFMNVEADIKGARLSWRPRPGAGGDPRTVPHGYKVYRRQGDSGAFALVSRLPAESTAYADGGLSDGVKYVYTLTAHNAEGAESEYSAKLSATPLSAPVPVRASSGRIRQIELSWDQYPGGTAEGYVIYRSAARDGRYEAIRRVDGLRGDSYNDSGLADNTTYWYRLSVYKKGGGETSPSEPVSAITRDVPPAPRNLSATGGEPRRIRLGWQLAGAAEDQIRRVIIYRTMDEKSRTMEKMGEVSGERNEFIDEKPPLHDKTTYHYRVCALNSGGAVSPQSEGVSATTKAPPQPPAKLAATSGEVRKVALRWDRNREPDVMRYQLFRKRSTDADFRQIRELSDNLYEDTGLDDGTELSYKIRAIDRDGLISAFSDTVTARTKPLPARVAGLRVADPVRRLLTWQQNQEKDLRGYNIYRKGFLGNNQKIATVRENHWSLNEGKGKIELYVTAVDDAGLESEPSETLAFE